MKDVSYVIAGSGSVSVAARLSEELASPAIFPKVDIFPDGEVHVELGEDRVRGTAIYVQTMHPSPDRSLVEACITIELLKDLGAEKVVAVIPYLAFTRQDTRHVPGEAVAIRPALKMLDACGADLLLSVDIHLHRLGLGEMSRMTRMKIHEASAVDLLAKEAGRTLKSPIVVGPDSESERWAVRAAEILDGGYDVLEKKRLSPSRIEITPKNVDVSGRDVLIIDDIVSTGCTMVEVIRSMKEHGASRIEAAFTHGVLAGGSGASLLRAGASRLISTNTINNEFSIVDVSPAIAERLKEIL
jgi:ribose-phosphate pyrophosphokinase